MIYASMKFNLKSVRFYKAEFIIYKSNIDNVHNKLKQNAREFYKRINLTHYLYILFPLTYCRFQFDSTVKIINFKFVFMKNFKDN